MIQLSHQDIERVSTGLRGIYSCLDVHVMPQVILSLLAELVPADFASYNEFNEARPQDVVAVTKPMLPQIMAHAAAFEAHVTEHPHISYYRRSGDGRPHKTTDLLSRRQYHRLGIYNEFFALVGIEYQLGGFFSGGPGLDVGLALNRKKSDFVERDREVLALLHPHLAQAYQNAAAFTLVQRKTEILSEALEATNQGLIVLNSVGAIAWLTPHAVRILEQYFPGGMRNPTQLPDILQRWTRSRLDTLNSGKAIGQPLEPLVIIRAESRLTIRIVGFRPDEQRLLLVEEPTVRSAPHRRALGLTEREAEVLHWISEGKTNPEIGAILSVSPRTVHKHVEHILAKLGVENRGAAVRTALDLK